MLMAGPDPVVRLPVMPLTTIWMMSAQWMRMSALILQIKGLFHSLLPGTNSAVLVRYV